MSVTLIGKSLYKSIESNPSGLITRQKRPQEPLSLPFSQAPRQQVSEKPPTPRPSRDLLQAYFINKKTTSKLPSFQGCRDDAQKLWEEYTSGQKTWSDMLAEAHDKENTGRAAVLHQWNILPADYHPKADEDVVFRTGTDPTASVGRGEFSDEDLTANTLNAWQHLQEAAQKHHFTIQYDDRAGFFSIPELNTLVWKPKEPVSLKDEQRFFKYLQTASTHPEVVDPASSNPKFPMEYVLAMINKGQNGLCDPVEDWGNGYQRYETLIQLAKSTHHALEKTGLAQTNPKAFNRLWALCKMKKSPEELGIFKPGDPEATVLNGLKREQSAMQELMAASFNQARQDLAKQIQDFSKFLKTRQSKAPTGIRPEQQALYENPEDTYQRLCKIKIQLDILSQSQHHGPFIQRLFNDPSGSRRKSFVEFQDSLKQQIEEVSNISTESIHFPKAYSLNWLGQPHH